MRLTPESWISAFSLTWEYVGKSVLRSVDGLLGDVMDIHRLRTKRLQVEERHCIEPAAPTHTPTCTHLVLCLKSFVPVLMAHGHVISEASQTHRLHTIQHCGINN